MKKKILTLACYGILSLLNTAQAAHYHDDISAFPPWKQGENLGKLELQVSTSSARAYHHFQIGLKLLHTYEFPEAIWSMREAQRHDPEMAMAYWGEIIASQMLVWQASDEELAQSALRRMNANANFSRLSPLEKGMIDAARALISPNPSKLKNFEAGSPTWKFRHKMALLHQQFPNVHAVKVFYGYSILGTRQGVRDFATNAQAITLFKEVLAENPQHPGALHYLLHATENPVQSYLGRFAAETFADVASASIHALHMPSHYYFTLGDWQRVIDINRHALKQSQQRATDLKMSPDTWEFHGQGWVIYALLQQNKEADALKEIDILYSSFAHNPSHTIRRYLLFARAGFLVDSNPSSKEHRAVKQATVDYKDIVSAAVTADIMARAYVGWRTTNKAEVASAAADYKKVMEQDLSILAPPEYDATLIMDQMTQAFASLIDGKHSAAETALKKAVRMEDDMIHEHGIPVVAKPANEMYADYLLQQERYGEALLHYRRTLDYFPKRSAALKGEARAMSEIYNALKL